jgi:hypothetical protein
LVGDTGVSRENHLAVASQWQTLSHYVVSSTPPHEWGLLWVLPVHSQGNIYTYFAISFSSKYIYFILFIVFSTTFSNIFSYIMARTSYFRWGHLFILGLLRLDKSQKCEKALMAQIHP